MQREHPVHKIYGRVNARLITEYVGRQTILELLPQDNQGISINLLAFANFDDNTIERKGSQ